jgi:hypothetical protein
MDLMYLKLRNGENILGQVETLNNGYRVTSPIEMEMDPREGIYGKSWLMLSKENSVLISKDDVFFCHEASEKAITYYEEFIYQFSQPDDENTSDLEDMLTTLLESRVSTKH